MRWIPFIRKRTCNDIGGSERYFWKIMERVENRYYPARLWTDSFLPGRFYWDGCYYPRRHRIRKWR